jgi:hypothetical protein
MSSICIPCFSCWIYHNLLIERLWKSPPFMRLSLTERISSIQSVGVQNQQFVWGEFGVLLEVVYNSKSWILAKSHTLYCFSCFTWWCGMWVQRNSHSSRSIIGNHLHFGTPVLPKYRKSKKCIPKWDCASHNRSSHPFWHFSCPSPTSWCIAFAWTALECNQMYVL